MFKRTSPRLGAKRPNRIKSYNIYNQSDINQILYNTPLSMVIKNYLPLTKTKVLGEFTTICPFCRYLTENKKHFRISDKKGLYKCYECGAGGTKAVSFLMRYHEIPFDRAIEFINIYYHNSKFKLRKIGTVVKKGRNCTDESLPF